MWREDEVIDKTKNLKTPAKKAGFLVYGRGGKIFNGYFFPYYYFCL